MSGLFYLINLYQWKCWSMGRIIKNGAVGEGHCKYLALWSCIAAGSGNLSHWSSLCNFTQKLWSTRILEKLWLGIVNPLWMASWSEQWKVWNPINATNGPPILPPFPGQCINLQAAASVADWYRLTAVLNFGEFLGPLVAALSRNAWGNNAPPPFVAYSQGLADMRV